MFRVWPDIGDPAAAYGDIRGGDNLAAVNIYPTAVPDNQIRRLTPHRDVDQHRSYFRPWFSFGHLKYLHWKNVR
jgi:hypothetical protein